MPDAWPRSSISLALHEAAERLERAGVAQPRREARALWATLAGVNAGDVWLCADRGTSDVLPPEFWESVERRSSGIPFAYAVGRVSFRHLELKLDARALIPRPETEGLVDLVLDYCTDNHAQRATRNAVSWGKGERRRGKGGVAADIGTGCGCLALALATEGEFDRVIAIDRSPDAAALARENIDLVEPSVPVAVREGDLLAPLVERCAVIVANPPYLTEAEYVELDPAVRQFEPREALVSGPDGLDATRALLAGARSRLEPGGLLAIEIDERRARAVRDIAREHGWRAMVRQDLFGRERYLLGTM